MSHHNPSIVALVLTLVSIVAPGQVNGSFENSPAGSSPTGWTVTGGNAVVVSTPDDLFPSHGAKYLKIDPGTTTSGSAVEPHYGPHATGTVGQIKQVVTMPIGVYRGLFVDWEFISLESLTGGANDYLSIDLVNDTTNALITNVVFVHAGSSASASAPHNVPGQSLGPIWVPNQTTVAGGLGLPAPAGFKRAWVDLSAVPFNTPVRIEISVGNDEDAFVDSVAYIDRVMLTAGQRNITSQVALRVLGSPHADGVTTSADWGGDPPETPYHFRTSPGQSLTVRAKGIEGGPWILIAGTEKPIGDNLGGTGLLNIDLALPFTILIDGTSTANPVAQWLGTLHPNGNFLDLVIPASTPSGTSVTLQAAMWGGSSFILTAATTIEVGPPQMPIGTASLAGATTDNGASQVFIAGGGPGSWPFYGIARTSFFVNANGSITFGSGNIAFTETDFGMFGGPPRIAALWDDFDAGDIAASVKATQTSTTLTVSWLNVPEWGSNMNANNFTIQMYHATGPTPAGVFTIYFGSTTIKDGLCGITPGALPAPAAGSVNSTDLSSVFDMSLGATFGVSPLAPFFQEFGFHNGGPTLMDTLDLMTLGGTPRITFVPNGVGGYEVLTGTR